jgi:hypothetical protein
MYFFQNESLQPAPGTNWKPKIYCHNDETRNETDIATVQIIADHAISQLLPRAYAAPMARITPTGFRMKGTSVMIVSVGVMRVVKSSVPLHW